MPKLKCKQIIIAIAILLIISSGLFFFIHSSYSPNIGSVRYVGEPGVDLIEWNGRIYRSVSTWPTFPNMKRGEYLGEIIGMKDCRAYKIKNDIHEEYLLVYAGGWFMADQAIYKAEPE